MARSAPERRYELMSGSSAASGRRWKRWVVAFVGVAAVVALVSSLADRDRAAPTAAKRASVLPLVRQSGSRLAQEADQPALVASLLPVDPLPAPVPAASSADEDVLRAADEAAPPAPAPAPAGDETARDAPPVVPAVAFLFLTINGEVVFPEVWAEFFRGASDTARFNVYVHRSNGDTAPEVSWAAQDFLEACRGRAQFVPTAPDTAWGQLIAAERSLAAAALQSPANVAFVYVSHTTLPVKSFGHVYRTLTARGSSSSFCVTTQRSWVRSRADPDVVFPKHSQWMVLSRDGAARFADTEREDAVAAVNDACGGSWRNCYPATSEELVMASITGGVPAAAMGSDWLAAHPPPGRGADDALVTALRAEVSAGFDDGGPMRDIVPVVADVNEGGVPVRDIGATNMGVCDTWHWWDDFPSDAALEPAFEPYALLARWAAQQEGRDPDAPLADEALERLLERHVDRFWSPPYHPQELRRDAMTADFLLRGLCASKALFARKFAPDFSLRDAPLPRRADGNWECPAAAADGGDDAADGGGASSSGGVDVWQAARRARLDGLSCDGMRHAPVAGVGARECRALCCAMGRHRCTAWQYRGRWSPYHFCWVGHPGRCSEYGEAQAQLWRGERLEDAEAAPPPNATAAERRRVVDAFTRCFAQADGAAAPAPAPEAAAEAAAEAPAPSAALAGMSSDESAAALPAQDEPEEVPEDATAAAAAEKEEEAPLATEAPPELSAAAEEGTASVEAAADCSPGEQACAQQQQQQPGSAAEVVAPGGARRSV